MGTETSSRSVLCPVVLQVSSMDCGPAAMTSLLRGHGMPANPEGLRDLCNTDVDGTSIDDMASLVNDVGLRARQLVVPADHLRSKALELLPAIAIIELPDGLLHFVVLWRRVGSLFEVMDPAVGRRWLRWTELEPMLHRHTRTVPADAWRSYAGTAAFLGPLDGQLAGLGMRADEREKALDTARSDPTWHSLAVLDARARAAGSRRHFEQDPDPAPEHWMVRATGPHEVSEPCSGTTRSGEIASNPAATTLEMSGVVILSVDGRGEPPPEGEFAAVVEPAPNAWRVLWALLDARKRRAAAMAMVAVGLAAGATPMVAFALERLVARESAGWSASLLTVTVGLAALTALSWAGTTGVLGSGRNLELAVRRHLDRRLGRLPERFFASRPASDLAERAHAMHRLRELPVTASDSVTATVRLAACVVGLLALAPSSWAVILALLVAAAAVPVVALPVLTEADHRSRTLAGCISRVHLDTLVGLFPVRAHRAEPAMRNEHRVLLEPWERAEWAARRRGALMVLASQVPATTMAVWLISGRMADGGELGTVLLVAFLALLAVDSGLVAVLATRRLAQQAAAARRLVALLTHDLDPEPSPVGWVANSPAALELVDVCVGPPADPVLHEVSLRIRPGEHVAVVGASGAGKSTLVAAMLGWADRTGGEVLLDGEAMTDAAAVALRERTVWVDPTTAIWSGTFSDNIGAAGPTDAPGMTELEQAARISELTDVVASFGGFGAHVGEAGRLLSGGQAQRVRIARGAARQAPRLVVLDEAFRGLDRDRRAEVMRRCRQQWGAVTLLWVTHHVDDTLDWDRVLVMGRRTLLEDGKPAELRASAGAYSSLLEGVHALRGTLSPDSDWTEVTLSANRSQADHTGLCPRDLRNGDPGNGDLGNGDPSNGDLSNGDPGNEVAAGGPGDSGTASRGGGAPSEAPRGEAPSRHRAAILAWLAVALSAAAFGTALYVRGWVGITEAAGGGAVLWGAALIASAVLVGIYELAVSRSGVQIGVVLRRRLMCGVLAADLDSTRNEGSARLLGRLMEFDAFEQLLVVGGSAALLAAVHIAGAFVAGVLGAAPAAVLGALACWVVMATALIANLREHRGRWATNRVTLSGLLVERFRGHRTEQVYGPPPHSGEQPLAIYESAAADMDRRRAALVGALPLGWLAVGTGIAIITAEGSNLLVAIGVVLLAWEGFGLLADAGDELVNAETAASQFRALLDNPGGGSPTATDELVAGSRCDSVGLEQVSYRYPDTNANVLTDVSLEVAPRSQVLLTGASGSGKTTAASILAGIRTPSGGAVFGSRRVCYTPQFGDNHIFEAPLLFNLTMGRNWPPEEDDWDDLDATLSDLGLDPLVSRMPRGLAQSVGECGWQLSHGERTRIFLGRALMQRPEVLVLDETLAGLDPRTSLNVLDHVRRVVDTVVVITHR